MIILKHFLWNCLHFIQCLRSKSYSPPPARRWRFSPPMVLLGGLVSSRCSTTTNPHLCTSVRALSPSGLLTVTPALAMRSSRCSLTNPWNCHGGSHPFIYTKPSRLVTWPRYLILPAPRHPLPVHRYRNIDSKMKIADTVTLERLTSCKNRSWVHGHEAEPTTST